MTIDRRFRWLPALLLLLYLPAASAATEVKLLVPSGYVPGVPFLARVEALRDGKRDTNLWDAEAILRSDRAGVTIAPSTIGLRNGLGTALLVLGGSGDFTLSAQVGAEEARRLVRDRASESKQVANGRIGSGNNRWSGVVSVTGNVLVPAGETLTIDAGTLVIVDGTASGTAGVSLTVNGAVRSLGTEETPVSITVNDASLNWGQIRHANAQASIYEHTFITKAGRAPGEGHTGTGPAMRIDNSAVTLNGCVISDLTAGGATIGKAMMASSSDLMVRDSVMARARMGPEIAGTGLLCADSYFMEMRGPDDCDGIYLHNSGNRTLTLTGCVFAGGDDDAVDTLNANVMLEGCILRDWPNSTEDAKGVSVFHGEVILRRCLIVNCFVGVSAKSSGPLATVRMDHCTVTAIDKGASAAFKANATAGNISFFVTNSIVRAPDAIHSDFGPARYNSVTYCNLSEPWAGAGNITADPLFVNAEAGDYRLRPGSPCIDAGDPVHPPDADLSRTDIGFYTGQSTAGGFYVSLLEPRSGAIFAGPTNVLLKAAAESSTSTIIRVEFFEAARKLGERSAAPYELTWSNLLAGTYTVRAVATRGDGVTSTSAPVTFSVTAGEGPSTNLLVSAGSIWRYLDNGTDQGTAWRQASFDDRSWRTGNAKLGYGDGDEATILSFGPSANNKHITYYFRRAFLLEEDPARIERLTADLLRDDGAIVYVNGQEVMRRSMPAGEVNFRTLATQATDYPWESAPIDPGVLVRGTNVIAVEVHQGNATSSDMGFDFGLTAVFSAPTNARPLVAIVSPGDGALFARGANITIEANAVDPDGSIASVALYANGLHLTNLPAAPYRFEWREVAEGNHALSAIATDNVGLAATSAWVNVIVSAAIEPPRISAITPAPGQTTNLAEVMVSFSKAVAGVDAADLLVNGLPAVMVNGSGNTYIFALPPLAGDLAFSWAPNHGISDTFTPPHAFDHTAAEANWTYRNLDSLPPIASHIEPSPGAILSSLNRVTITFSEAVTGVDAADLALNSVPASTVSGTGAGPYEFLFPPPAQGTVLAQWSASHGINDASGNAFVGNSAWTYLVDTNVTGVIINEIMYHPASENVLEEYIELFNRGAEAVNVGGWQFSQGVRFVLPNASIPPGGYLVVAADLGAFRAKYPEVTNVVGNWVGTLSNSRETVSLDDARGGRVDSVRYADEGDWAVRERGVLDRGYRGWGWFAAHDGLGRSIELIDPLASNDTGQNWSSSIVAEGTPGGRNSVWSERSAPFVLDVIHAPAVPKSTDSVVVSARIVARPGQPVQAALHYRVDSLTPAEFTRVEMRDDGRDGDGAAGDGLYSGAVPPQANNTVVEFYVWASDGEQQRTWPAPAIAAPDGAGPSGQVANALYQVDDTEYASTAPLYKAIMREAERLELQNIGNNAGGSANSDAQMNATFIGIDGTGVNVRYSTGVRNRGHGSRGLKPNNFRINFRSDDTWKGVLALNLNAQFSWLQVLGAALHTKSGVVGAQSRGVQFRLNNANLVTTGGTDRTYGLYAANEAINSDWAERHFPNDSNGNIYRALRDLNPPEFDYRTSEAYPFLFGAENKNSYTNTFFKVNNASEDDWTDLMGMLRVMGPNGTEPFTEGNVRRVIDPEQWLRHLAVMNLLGNSETSLNTGHNDDYFMYRGVNDSRFILMFYDLDQILGFNGAFGASSSIYSASNNNGSGRAIGRLLTYPDFQPIYLETLRELIDTAFSGPEFNALVDQVLGDWVPAITRTQIKNYMEARRNFVRSQLPATAPEKLPWAVLSAAPRSPTPRSSAEFRVSGEGVAQYRYSINGGPLSAETPVDRPIVLANLPPGTNTLRVIGRNAGGLYQSTLVAANANWVIDPAWPGVRINEAIAQRSGNRNDQIELYNESSVPVDLTGLRLTDNRNEPGRYVFGNRTLGAGEFLVLDSSQLGFSLAAAGEGIYLFDRASRGGALLDSVEFGPQIMDFSIGRAGENGEWTLTQPTFGAANVAQEFGNGRRVRINEWLAFGVSPFPDDFVELFNPEALPVSLGGAFLTDRRVGDPRKSAIRPLSFIPARGHLSFRSGAGNDGNEINFSLPSEQGEITLFAADGSVIDSVVYHTQLAGVAMGRCADGDYAIRPLGSPTPGGANLCLAGPAVPSVTTLLPFDHSWRYNATGPDLGEAWREPGFNDSAWPSGPGLLGFEDAALAEPLRTAFPNPRATTYYFRTTFDVPPGLGASAIEATVLIDDGAAFYLNGEEVGTRFNLPPGATAQTFASGTVDNASPQSFSIPAEKLRAGANVFAVEVHQVNATSSDMVFGLRLDVLVYTNGTSSGDVAINELLVRNQNFPAGGGRLTSWVELHNASAQPADLTGMSLSRDVRTPAMWVFPSGSTIPAGGFLTIDFDPSSAVSASNTGFGLPEHGGAVYLFEPAAQGGAARTALVYGLQAMDRSIARHPGSGEWVLGLPTPGSVNLPVTLGNAARLKLNEWLASAQNGPDWFELYNPENSPVSLEGLAVSDSVSSPLRHRFPSLSFMGANSFLRLFADNQNAAGADHLNFALDATGEALAIARLDGTLIDAVTFGPQVQNVSEGRVPDGGEGRAFFQSPTPGGPNSSSADRDHDGLPDAWETQFGLNPDDPSDALADSDGDGVSNLAEYLAGTHPRDTLSVLRLNVQKTTAAGWTLEFDAQRGRAYEVLAAASVSGPWQRLELVPQSATARIVRIEIEPEGSARFFKVRLAE